MPITPFHGGLGLFAAGVVPKKISVKIFVLTQCLMDIQPILSVLGVGVALHGWSHTWFGGLTLGVVAILLYRWYDRQSRWRYIIGNAMFGTFSHIILDAIMHIDVASATGLDVIHNILSIYQLHMVLILGMIVGIVLLYAKGLVKKRE